MAHIVEIDFKDRRLVRRYEQLFDECPDACIQQSTDWADVIQDLGPDLPIFLLCEHDGRDIAALPLYLYEQPTGNILNSVPQPGPLGGVFCRGGLTSEVRTAAYRALLEQAQAIATRHDCVTLSLITNPFEDDLAEYETHLAPDYIFENFTQYVPLDQPAHRNHGHRNNLNRAKAAGFTISVCKRLDELDTWYALHKTRHTEIGAQPLDSRLFRNLFERLVSKGKAQLILVKRNGRIVSGGFYIHHRRVLDVFMISFDSTEAKNAPNFLNTDYSMEWAKGLGLTIYNWQSSSNKQSGVYQFKQQWGSLDRPYYFVTKVTDRHNRLASLTADVLRRHYPWHYVMPYGVFERGLAHRRFTKC